MHPGVQRAVQVRVQLPILLRRHAGGHDAQLAAHDVQPSLQQAPGVGEVDLLLLGLTAQGAHLSRPWVLTAWVLLLLLVDPWLALSLGFALSALATAGILLNFPVFYFGGLDAYRIAFNDDFSTAFVPPKQHVRSETVDSQRGEAEWRGGNLYYDQWDYRFEAKVLP